ncbi:fumarylacetoacetate hydrolase family protein [Microbacter margulisiae]|uniref:2-keto-4-pentenoate hydratase/2-oxohepta-3-ene-1,7-dioic acid hydratase in catechol pathway n=1 Tax=Microbacter margulisiae TaxID=1350067 RepID=A0A7W5H1Z3_9PORP|nr:fumarylacetoacetate hydrolase family protein [Microbacter margulisiae]MBB3187099.1 2-keto-4-pentenoate hydratase/2-oxohepta-3-ene-1,7-dioic acid hydratase in catechol pathway [Microbacter margulisiae]
MKVFAIGWNYLDHNKELAHDEIPTEPTFFMKADTAIVKDNKPFFYPSFSQEIDYETEIVVRINRLGKGIDEKFAPRYYGEIGLGIDFTARDLQRRQRASGGPWEICKSFDQSAPISHFLKVSQFQDIQNINFHLAINGKTVQTGNTRDMIFPINQIIAYLSHFFTLKTGDLIFTGTPVNVGPVNIGDHLQGFIEDNLMLDFWVR